MSGERDNQGRTFMTQVEQYTHEQAADGESLVGQAQEKVQEGAQQITEQARQAAVPVKERIREELSARSTQVADQAGALGQALRSSSDQLHSQGQSEVARLPEQAAQVIERCADYLRHSEGDRILQDIEDVCRRQPWAVLLGGSAVGFAASRLLKASSHRRYESHTASWAASRPAAPPPSGPMPAAAAAGTSLAGATSGPSSSPATSSSSPAMPGGGEVP
jgi:hypothetical protein